MRRNPRRSAGMKASDFDPQQLRRGTEVELEHTDSRRVARRIAMDHLAESPDYYRALDKMEASLMIENSGLGAKRPGAVVEGDWWVAKEPAFAGHVEPIPSWVGEMGIEPRRLRVRGIAVRMPDGRWKLQPSRAAAKRAYAAAKRGGDTRLNWADNLEQLVRKHLKKHRGRYIRARDIDEGLGSSYLYPARGLGWTDPDPFQVLLFTESGIGDPMHHPDVYRMIDQSVEAIAADPWYEDADWGSINPAVHYIWIKPKLIA